MIRPRFVLLGALLALAAAGPAAAQALDPSSQDALNKTLQILLDPNARVGELAKSSQWTAVDQQVRVLAGSDALTVQAADKGPSASLAPSAARST